MLIPVMVSELSSLSHDSGAVPARAELRRTLLARRPAGDRRAAHDAALTQSLAGLLATLDDCCIGFYWPIRGEFDVVAEVVRWLRAGPDANPQTNSSGTRRAALPVIHTRAAPLDFHLWTPETPMRSGQYNIPEPQGTAAVIPDILLIPCVGVDRQRYRMGYGGGYYDRTLAALFPRPQAIGIAYADTVVESIAPEAHDIALDRVVTEDGIW
jgi:5-formyltetrahydrofolate cyclo-ligase